MVKKMGIVILMIVMIIIGNPVIGEAISTSSVAQQALTQTIFKMNAQIQTLQRNANAKKIVKDPKSKSSLGAYSRRKGVILVTSDPMKGGLPTGHAAIAYDKDTVIEANWNGIVKGKHNWFSAKKQSYQVTVNKTTAKQDESAANYCKSKIGKPYNKWYLDTGTRKSFYCSQLVWAAYKDLFRIDLNTGAFKTIFGNPIHPVELVTSPQTSLIYRKK